MTTLSLSIEENMQNIDLGNDYGITSIGYSGGCAAETDISFDNLGRPIIGDISGVASPVGYTYLTADCNVTLNHPNEAVVITITPETGYAQITN